MSGDPFDISGATVAITGGAGQLGRNFAVSLSAAGARVAVLDVEQGKTPDSDSVAYFACDVTERASIEAALEAVEARFGTPAGLVNAAAIDTPPDAPAAESGPFEEFPATAWDRTMDVNVKGVFQCCQVFGGAMARAGRGSIVNIASIYALVAPDQRLYGYRRDEGETFFKPAAYATSKSALLNLTRYLAAYWGGAGVRVNSLTLGGVLNDQDRRFVEAYNAKVPLGRMARPDEYNGTVRYLLSDAASYMTGANLVVDGGYTAL